MANFNTKGSGFVLITKLSSRVFGNLSLIKQHIPRLISLTHLGFSVHICSIRHQEFHHVCLSCPGSHMECRLSPLKHTQRELLEKRYYCVWTVSLCVYVHSPFIRPVPFCSLCFDYLNEKHVSTVTVACCWPTVCLIGNSRA